MRLPRKCIGTLLLLVTAAAPVLAQARASQFDGAWRQVRNEVVSPDSTYRLPLLSGMTVVSGRHFSQIYLNAPPAGVQQASRPTSDDEKARRYELLTANAGTFEVRDTLIVYHFLHAKSPSVVGTSVTRRFRVRGDTLWLVTLQPFSKDSTKTVRSTGTFVRER